MGKAPGSSAGNFAVGGSGERSTSLVKFDQREASKTSQGAAEEAAKQTGSAVTFSWSQSHPRDLQELF